MEVREITYREAVEFLLPKHYSGRIPNIHKAFGWFDNDCLKAVITYGKPASPSLCKGVCGEQYSDIVWELNRMCRTEDLDKPLSQFVSQTLKLMSPSIIISYSDTAMNLYTKPVTLYIQEQQKKELINGQLLVNIQDIIKMKNKENIVK